MVWDPSRQLPKRYTVRWVDGGCKKPAFEEDGRPVMSADGRQMFSIRHHFVEKEVVFDGPVESNPHYFEVHIYPDHVVEIRVTEFPSLPDPKWIPDPASEVPSNVPCSDE